ncbi:conserved hypothetical protein [Paraburkholderia phytofirmans PsJN]|uniref:Uncharacterized protein n=1 Tax=Paraburkholderia phytofirmans (strain DSM 17436 / LMG 22146 / PsJN) TaxID=398527 RepID=B2T7H4_PARPJ|nr:conserved hypothetical protein [Paraburkholderia phytofirmans PsJN]
MSLWHIQVIVMHARIAPSPDVEPSTDLLHWRVMEILPDGHVHFVGLNSSNYLGRISSETLVYDSATHRAESRSGRIYFLRGPAGLDGVSEYFWSFWCEHNHISDYADITDQYQESDRDHAC